MPPPPGAHNFTVPGAALSYHLVTALSHQASVELSVGKLGWLPRVSRGWRIAQTYCNLGQLGCKSSWVEPEPGDTRLSSPASVQSGLSSCCAKSQLREPLGYPEGSSTSLVCSPCRASWVCRARMSLCDEQLSANGCKQHPRAPNSLERQPWGQLFVVLRVTLCVSACVCLTYI